MSGRVRWSSAVLVVAAVALAGGCGWGNASGSGSQEGLVGPDDTSNLWTALQWSINVDYPYYATVAEVADEADLVVRGRVVDVAEGRTTMDVDHAQITVQVERVLSDPDGRAPDQVTLSIPVNGSNDIARIAAEAPRPDDVILAVVRLGDDDPESVDDPATNPDEQQNTGGPTADPSTRSLYGMATNDSVIDFADGLSYTPFNDLGASPAPDDPFRGHTLTELEAAFLAADAASS